MNKKIFTVFLLILFYSFSYNNPYFYILNSEGIKKCFSDDCVVNPTFEKAIMISPFCKKIFVLSGKTIYNPNKYLIKENGFFDPITKTYISKEDGYLTYCVDKNQVFLFLVFNILYFVFIYFLSKCPCIKFVQNKILYYFVISEIFYLMLSFYLFENIITFYFDNLAALIFYIFMSTIFVLFSISKAFNLFFDKSFLYEMVIIFIILEIISLSSLNQLILMLTIIFLFIFSDQYQKMKLLISKSKPVKYENEEKIKKKFSKYCKINNIYIVKSDIANAYATGLINKDIYLTSKLVESLNEKEIESIIAHEVGHHYHKHLIKTFVIVVGLYIFIYLLPVSELIKLVLYVLYALFIFFGLGIIQNRFEKEADEFAAKIINKKDLISAIIKVAKINKTRFKTKSILHPSIEERIDYIFNSQ